MHNIYKSVSYYLECQLLIYHLYLPHTNKLRRNYLAPRPSCQHYLAYFGNSGQILASISFATNVRIFSLVTSLSMDLQFIFVCKLWPKLWFHDQFFYWQTIGWFPYGVDQTSPLIPLALLS